MAATATRYPQSDYCTRKPDHTVYPCAGILLINIEPRIYSVDLVTTGSIRIIVTDYRRPSVCSPFSSQFVIAAYLHSERAVHAVAEYCCRRNCIDCRAQEDPLPPSADNRNGGTTTPSQSVNIAVSE